MILLLTSINRFAMRLYRDVTKGNLLFIRLLASFSLNESIHVSLTRPFGLHLAFLLLCNAISSVFIPLIKFLDDEKKKLRDSSE